MNITEKLNKALNNETETKVHTDFANYAKRTWNNESKHTKTLDNNANNDT